MDVQVGHSLFQFLAVDEWGGKGGGEGGGGEGVMTGVDVCVVSCLTSPSVEKMVGGGWVCPGGEEGLFFQVLEPELGGSIQAKGGGGEEEWVECFAMVQVCPSDVCLSSGFMTLVVGGMKLSGWKGAEWGVGGGAGGGGGKGEVALVFDSPVLEEVFWTSVNSKTDKGDLVWTGVFHLKTLTDNVGFLKARYLRVFVMHESEILGLYFVLFLEILYFVFRISSFYFLGTGIIPLNQVDFDGSNQIRFSADIMDNGPVGQLTGSIRVMGC